jgi:hypothetical protein
MSTTAKQTKFKKTTSLFIGTGFLFVALTFAFFIELSSVAITILNIGIGSISYWLIDRFSIPTIDTYKLLSTDPKAYSNHLLAIAIIIAASILAS